MGLRFSKRIGFGPFRFNFSGSGISMSTGFPGMRATVPLYGKRRRRARVTYSIPGTGLSYSEAIGDPIGGERTAAPPPPPREPTPEENEANVRATFERAAQDQPASMRELIACLMISAAKHGDSERTMEIVYEHFPNVDDEQLIAASRLIADAADAIVHEAPRRGWLWVLLGKLANLKRSKDDPTSKPCPKSRSALTTMAASSATTACSSVRPTCAKP